jgi:hypothetical protein
MVGDQVELLVGVVLRRVLRYRDCLQADGTVVEFLKMSVRITSLTDQDAAEMLHSLATFLLLRTTGAPKTDVAALKDLLLRVSARWSRSTRTAKLDRNPLMCVA